MPFAAGVCCDGDNCEPVLGCRGAFHSNVSTLYEPQNGGCVGRTVQEGALGHGPSVVVLGGKCNGVRPRFSVFFGGVVYLQRRKKILYTLLLFTSRVNWTSSVDLFSFVKWRSRLDLDNLSLFHEKAPNEHRGFPVFWSLKVLRHRPPLQPPRRPLLRTAAAVVSSERIACMSTHPCGLAKRVSHVVRL